MAAPRRDEPLSTISAVLTTRQIVWLNDEADRRGVKRTAVLREVVERGIESAPKADDSEKEQQAA